MPVIPCTPAPTREPSAPAGPPHNSFILLQLPPAPASCSYVNRAPGLRSRLHPDAAGPCQNSDEHAASLPERDLANAVGRYVLPTPTAPRTSLQWPASAKRNETRSDNARRSAGRRVRFRCRSACSNSTRPSPNVLVPNAIRGVTLRRPKQFQEGEVAELVLSGQRQSLRQDVLR